MIIIGAGLSGCLAGALDKKARIYERAADLPGNHRAVLRFRDDKIAQALGIPFRKVRVHKSVFLDGRHIAPNLLIQNMYSRKVTGIIADRSINDLQPVTRYVAPGDFHALLAEMCAGRIHFNSKIERLTLGAINFDLREGLPVISTIPMPHMLGLLGIKAAGAEFINQSIHVERWKVPDCDVHQTIYFPGDETLVYRMTLTGPDLIVESIKAPLTSTTLSLAQAAFGIRDAIFSEEQDQRYGKIVPLPDGLRKSLLLEMSLKFNVFSLGRFACWRNILLDDVYEDFFKIRKMAMMSRYDIVRSVS